MLSVSVSTKVISNFAWQHLKAATTFREQVRRLELEHSGKEIHDFFVEIRSYASACIMSSAASLEALINELYIAHDSSLRATFSDFELGFWREEKPRGLVWKGTVTKYQLALERLGLAPMDTKSSNYVDASYLIDLRHALLHYKPAWDKSVGRRPDLSESLANRFELSPFPSPNDEFVGMRCMSAGCASWCITTVLNFLREFDAVAKIDPNKMVNFWRLDEMQRA